MASHLIWQISACTVLHLSSLHPISTHSLRGDKWKYSVLGVKRDPGAMDSLSFEKNILSGKMWEEDSFGAGGAFWMESGPGGSQRVASRSYLLVLSQPGNDLDL